MADSIISGSDGTSMKGSITPCRAYPTAIIHKLSENPNNCEGPTHMFTKKDKVQAVIRIARFSMPRGRNCTIMLVGI